ncbi:class I SAM-dependent methyltransferase [Mesorhizobium sp. LHD-90]|uniref:class I SAM-dependent methyltransferase n=1 Tax=Mesorhizobium sp. LHD-90 TaxID=3071414 RepID=UPI0027DF55AD|nr:class I SAM-dependent methyltransferase [Mesorhizobium sp. LHD-90]MDQ6437967.1 class I SAM-dependent methyltransferase [Mesorhizobium sp. LHD-90]
MHQPDNAARPCPAYTEHRLAKIYDVLNPLAQSDLFYLDLARGEALNILDVGCGTGRLAVDFARRCHRVTGVDPAQGMLTVARSRPGGKSVTWIEGDVAAVPATEKFDLAIMSGNVFQVFLSDEAARMVLAGIAQRLTPAGRLVFESRNPAAREWESWTPAETAMRVEAPDLGTVNVHYDVTGVDSDIVRYDTHFAFADGETIVAPSALRFTDKQDIFGLLAEAGLKAIDIQGDWDGSAFTEESPEIIITAGLNR